MPCLPRKALFGKALFCKGIVLGAGQAQQASLPASLPRQSFAEDESPALEIGVDGRVHLKINSKCKSLGEWESSFLEIALSAPSKEGGKILLLFRDWFCLRANQFGFKVMLEFYDFLMRLVREEKTSMEMARVVLVWRDFQLRKMADGVDLFTPGTPRSRETAF
ncbi:hypothetical protein CYMTET_41035 [Cymbomonas tetramitiformis]|uniref:Uncharacterized protein n=1 Tax=Cymbomonas tetramitiformis TaxID=36881 RepID=A0AAE0C6W9_9CHLO|nr:hypothetical protein CYMTET_41035 [Cymbomonas tetramitiformis]